ncbi:hypothetical protein CJ179_38900 [Rhodococcus sp. ACS1]|uniref:hypothetical protein n=1 Tax=Rhodococcus sp. ACS1 TaxID=2028570 RepID=UPI000BB10ED7|nr:hypothetical protein [Rhodococcus sp. ACS1]PBC38566.1 hypothetical protein CJ179_38900 [Rhodococcus sp. ACS1]
MSDNFVTVHVKINNTEVVQTVGLSSARTGNPLFFAQEVERAVDVAGRAVGNMVVARFGDHRK